MSRRPTIGSAPKRDLRRIVGTLAILALLVSVLALLFSLATFHPEHKPGFEGAPRQPYTPALNPIALAELGLAPDTPGTDRVQLATLAKDRRVRLISLRREGVSLMQGGQLVRFIETPVPPEDLDQLVTIVGDGSWVDRRNDGHVVLNSALVIYGGVRFTFGGPSVQEISLTDRFSVFLGVLGGTAAFENVQVRAIDSETSERHRYRPFVIAMKGAVMTMRGSEFSGLGWDWNGSYGVSWVQGSTGEAIDSIFRNSFIGVYTSRAVDLSFRRCAFRDNSLYGLDPHTFSKNLTVDNIVAEGNGAHGIIFSDHVTESTITNSISRKNGQNGIMMDKRSTGNRIENNTVIGNRGDGLVTSDSSDNVFVNNTVESNRVGVRVDPPDSGEAGFRGNRILRNGSATEDITLSDGNVVRGNGGNWNHDALKRIWPAAAVGLGLIGIVYIVKTHPRLRKATVATRMV